VVDIKVNSRYPKMHQLMYHIGYMNANSLCDRKFAQAIHLLETSFDFLFIAEHWYQHHQSRLLHPLVHCSTTLSPRPPIRPSVAAIMVASIFLSNLTSAPLFSIPHCQPTLLQFPFQASTLPVSIIHPFPCRNKHFKPILTKLALWTSY